MLGFQLKTLALLACLAAPVARADFLDELKHPVVTQGPTFPVLEYRAGASTPFSLGAGAGYQVGAGFFQRKFFGNQWDLLDLDLAAFGTGVVQGDAASPRALSVACLVCLLSNSICVGGGLDVLGSEGTPLGGFTWKRSTFLLLAWSINFDFIKPQEQRVHLMNGDQLVADFPVPGPAPRGNTLNFGAP